MPDPHQDRRRPVNSRQQRWAVGIAAWLCRQRITPNQISLASSVFALAGALALVGGSLVSSSTGRAVLMWLAVICIQGRLLCNLFDGMVAVEGGKRTPAGELFNDLPDRVSDVLLISAAGFAGSCFWPPALWLGVCAAFLAVMTAYARVLGASMGAPMSFAGPMAKQHRMAVLTLDIVLSSLTEPGLWQNGLIMTVTTLVLLIVASGLCAWRQHRVPERDDTELRQRIRSWWWMIGLLFAALLFSRWTALCFFAPLSYLALKGFFSIVPTRLIDRRVLFWAYLTVPLQYLWIGLGWTTMAITCIPVYALLWLPVRLVLLGEPDGFIRSAGVIFWMVMLAVYGLSHLGGLVMLPVSDLPAGYAGPVLFLILMTQSNDVAQYVWGRSFGRRQVVPAISPGKTWGGL